MVSSSQIKAARAMLGWSAIELANRSGVGSASIKRYEVQSGIPIANTKNLMVIRNTFEEAGIEFTGVFGGTGYDGNFYTRPSGSESWAGFANEDVNIGVVLLSAEGPSTKDGVYSFCSGGDQKARGHQGYVGDDGYHRLNILEVQRLIRFMPKAVIAVVPGWAVGGGHSLHVI